jgi:N-acetyl-gamma-glutamyl-phosphate reductase common form
MSFNRLPVAVVGASGFLGGELLRLLAHHPQVELAYLGGSGSVGRTVGELRGGLAAPALSELTIEPTDAEAIAERCELALLALPHGQSAALTRQLLTRGCRVIDLGSDFRLRDAADYPRYYGREHPCPELLGEAFYGLPELTGAPPAGCQLVANPGCFATAMALGLAPLAPLLRDDARVAISGVTGSSGSGAAASPRVHHALRTTNLGAYKVLEHQHLGELRQLLAARRRDGRAPAVDFVPHSGPLVRGIHLTLMLRASELTGDPLEALERAYADAPLCRVREDSAAQLAAVVGSCRAELGLFRRDGAVVLTVAIDNLLKGGSGQAVQNLNLLCGFGPLTALPTMGIWP